MSDPSAHPLSAPYFIKYNPLLKRELGSQNAVLIFDRLEYWFSKKKNQFYKFIEPCDHPLCKKGDTWTEELDVSKKVFRNAFDLIGTRYISKTAFEKEEDPFKGKFFAYYQDRQTKKTIFIRNNALLKSFYKTLESKSLGLLEKVSKKVSPRANPKGSPHVRVDNNISKQINTSFQKDDLKNSEFKNQEGALERNLSKPISDIIAIWKEELEGKGIPTLTSSVTQKISKAFETHFSSSLENWKAYCQKIASSKFLMGEKEKTYYEIRLMVALSKTFIDQVEEGRYELNTRESVSVKKRKKMREKLKALALNKELIENQLSRLKDQEARKRKEEILRKVEALSTQERETLKTQFEQEQQNCDLFKREGWESKIIQFQFESYLWKRVEESLEATESEAATKSLQAEKGIIEKKYDQVMVYLRELLACQENLAKNFSR